MQHLTLIVHTDAQQDLIDQLHNLEQVSGFTFSHVEGHGLEVVNDPFLLSRDKVVGHTPRIRMDILLQDADIDTVLDSLRSTSSYVGGHGIYWVTAVEKNGHL